MSAVSAQVVAVDLGATSGRVVVGDFGADGLTMRTIARFPNGPVTLWDGSRTALHADIPGLYGHVVAGLTQAGRDCDNLAGIGVDSWAVDYGLLRDGRLLSLPMHYRDARTERGVALVHDVITAEELYQRNGIQFLPFNTVYQLADERVNGLLELADTVLLVPDLITYWLTGQRVAERTNASTTGLLGLDGVWDHDLMNRLKLPHTLFPELVEAGSRRGPLLPEVAAQLGFQTEVASAASHDTASAVAAIPMHDDQSAYISCGTWGLVGVELAQPVTTEASRAANFTNEVGADGRIRFLHNVMGLWLLSETLRHYERDGRTFDLAVLLEQAAEQPAPVHVFDADDPRFLPPGDMPDRIAQWYRERDLPVPHGPAAVVRTILESLAAAFASAVTTAAELSGIPVRTVHIVGGGAQNELLCQLIADRVGLPLLAGPVEATALGNILLTARAQGIVSGGLPELRERTARWFSPRRYVPRTNRAALMV
ncbi:rhamnulokinase [Mycolicibacterium mageritense]|uniref:Rhamnulokinase n=1 Tax=Mycolicibacterium mageritense TaxID=53462 RepID=A0AAI8TV33_MYCME|nr:rhamnulokinase family protein [Mycolicibacterium mageritense]TXI66051.1 MAG: rhamnulokinase [Mycolicibacterium mageritense]BDY29087.1 Rhamnulokinase [Mycolicibacterium mageritense]